MRSDVTRPPDRPLPATTRRAVDPSGAPYLSIRKRWKVGDRMDAQPALTVYFDGACPLCAREIALYRRCRGAERIAFVDVAAQAPLGAGLDRAAALARFHVRDADGRLVSGARAFARLWAQLPAWQPLALLLRVPGALTIAELAYRAFLPLRPGLARILPAPAGGCNDSCGRRADP